MTDDEIKALQFKVEELQLEVTRANDMERYWRDGHEVLFKKHYQIPPVKATFSPGANLREMHWEYAKAQLHKAGLLKLLDILDVRAVRIVDFKTLTADLHDSFGTIDAPSRTILLDDSLPFPWPVLPSTIVHEALHLYQTDIGIANDHKKTEIMAYVLSAVFHWLNEDGIGVFHVDPDVVATWPVAIELGQGVWG